MCGVGPAWQALVISTILKRDVNGNIVVVTCLLVSPLSQLQTTVGSLRVGLSSRLPF